MQRLTDNVLTQKCVTFKNKKAVLSQGNRAMPL